MRTGRYRRRHDGGEHPRAADTRCLLTGLGQRLPAALPVPGLRVVPGPTAGSHLYQRPRHPPEVRVTDQLLDRAPDQVLSGVLGHELAHLINGDLAAAGGATASALPQRPACSSRRHSDSPQPPAGSAPSPSPSASCCSPSPVG